MQGAVLYGTGDVRLQQLPDPAIVEPTDAIIRLSATCICGSDLWDYRDTGQSEPRAFGHEYCGIVEEVGADVTSVNVGQFVVGSFCVSDNTYPVCRLGFHSSCQSRQLMQGCQAELVRVPLADGTLVATPDVPDAALIPKPVGTVGRDGHRLVCRRYGQCETRLDGGGRRRRRGGSGGVVAASLPGAERIIAVSRHKTRQQLAPEFGATDVVEARGPQGAERIKKLTGGAGADSVLKCVGKSASMEQARLSARPGGSVGFVGVPQGVSVELTALFDTQIGLRGGLAPVRRYLPQLMNRVLHGEINPGKVFDMTLPLEDVATGYNAMNERRAIKVLLVA